MSLEEIEKLEAMIYRREQWLTSLLAFSKTNKEMNKTAFLISVSLANLKRKIRQAIDILPIAKS